mmetsp:Transcript_87411/g.234083  ORF Transcript_87411/g.234083 Transcript_87411/m.234083 type:complete len:477 (+) Transcript_87411:569-1999(+)
MRKRPQIRDLVAHRGEIEHPDRYIAICSAVDDPSISHSPVLRCTVKTEPRLPQALRPDVVLLDLQLLHPSLHGESLHQRQIYCPPELGEEDWPPRLLTVLEAVHVPQLRLHEIAGRPPNATLLSSIALRWERPILVDHHLTVRRPRSATAPIEFNDTLPAQVAFILPESRHFSGDHLVGPEGSRGENAVGRVSCPARCLPRHIHKALRRDHVPMHLLGEEIIQNHIVIPRVVPQRISDGRLHKQPGAFLPTQAVGVDQICLERLIVLTSECGHHVSHRDALVLVEQGPIHCAGPAERAHSILHQLVGVILRRKPRPAGGRAECVQEVDPEVVRPGERQQLPSDEIFNGGLRSVELQQALGPPNYGNDIVHVVLRVAQSFLQSNIRHNDLLIQILSLRCWVLVGVIAILAVLHCGALEICIKSLAIPIKNQRPAALAANLYYAGHSPIGNIRWVGNIKNQDLYLGAATAERISVILP